MSAVKFEYPTYKLFEPHCHPQRPIIVGVDAIESPDTVTLRYEEEAAERANGGGLRGDSPPGLLCETPFQKPQPPQMQAFESPRSYQDPQYQYSAQHYAAQQSENAAAQLNQMAFAANSQASQYMPPVMPTLTSYHPSNGLAGTKVLIKFTAPYDWSEVTSQAYLLFGAHKGSAHAARDDSNASNFGYVVTGEAPYLEDTRSSSNSMPLSLLIESAEGQTLVTIQVGTFTYHDVQAGALEGAPEGVTRKLSKSPEDQDPPKQEMDQLSDTATNTYGYPPNTHQAAVASGYDTGYASNNTMIGTYHRPTTYGIDYPRPSLLKVPSWSPYASLADLRSPMSHATISRSSMTPLPMPNSATPLLKRTSTIQASSASGAGQLSSYAFHSAKAILKINGDLESMASNWSQEEWDNRRRIVMFNRKQQGSTLTTTFKPVAVGERPPNSICISCIYWAEKNECYVTSVDTIYLLEQLIQSPVKFTVEEKNRIRRNLEGFRPLTVSKAKPDSEEFFKIIMGFPNPRPRNIEKDVKVFPWKILSSALKKIISKYSATPSSPVHHGHGHALLTPVSSASPGLYGPPTVSDAYAHHDTHAMLSPRSLSSAPPSWATYTGRTLSPSLKTHSPQLANIRIPSLPYGPTDGRQHSAHGYSLTTGSQRWDAAYSDASAVASYTSQSHPNHVYGNGHYSSQGAHRE